MEKLNFRFITIVAGLLLIILIAILNAPGVITIESEQGAAVSVATERNGEFKEIGTTKAKHFAFKMSDELYIASDLDGKRTITSVTPQRFSSQTVTLTLTDLVAAEKVSDGAVRDAIFNGTKGQGIVHGQDALIGFDTSIANAPGNPEFAGLPYVTKVIWKDFNNFVYLTDSGVGQFINGKDQGLAGIGAKIRGDVRVELTNDAGSPLIVDMAQSPGKPLVFLSHNNIFISDALGSNLRAITSFDLAERDISLFASDDSVFKVSAPELGHAHSEKVESDEYEELEAQQPTVIEEFLYDGQRRATFKISDGREVIDVVKKNDITYVLTAAGIYTIDDEEKQDNGLYFTDVAGMTIYKGQIVVLADDGLWRVSEDNKSFQLLHSYTKNGTALPGSLMVSSDGKLLFGTQQDGNRRTNSATFRLSL